MHLRKAQVAVDLLLVMAYWAFWTSLVLWLQRP